MNRCPACDQPLLSTGECPCYRHGRNTALRDLPPAVNWCRCETRGYNETRLMSHATTVIEWAIPATEMSNAESLLHEDINHSAGTEEGVRVVEYTFIECDSSNPAHASAYYRVKIEGSPADIERVEDFLEEVDL